MNIDFFARWFALERGYVFLSQKELETANGRGLERVAVNELALLFSWGGKLLVRIRRDILDVLIILEDETRFPKNTFTADYLKSVGNSFIENHPGVVKTIHFRVLYLLRGSEVANYDFERIKTFASNSDARIKFSAIGVDSENGKIYAGGDSLHNILNGIFLRGIFKKKEHNLTGSGSGSSVRENLWFNQNRFVLACLSGFFLAVVLRLCLGMMSVPTPFFLLTDVLSCSVALGISMGQFWGRPGPQGLVTVLTFAFSLYPFLIYWNGFPDRVYFISLILNTLGLGTLVFVFERLKESV